MYQTAGKKVRGSGNTYTIGNAINRFNPVDFISSIDSSNTRFIANKCRQEVMLLKLKFIYKLLLHITKVLSKFIFIYKSNKYLLYVLRDLCLHRLWKSNPKVNKKQPNFYYG